ncbi:MAG: IS1182 family transposase [Thermoanaerobaculia bacterium]|nr:IS1182 family transposase [Thermoanaerobaculia bacterium]
MARHFVPVDRDTSFLLPPSVQEWLPEGHLARFVVEIVEQLDLAPLEAAYTGRGSRAYHPGMLLGLLFYGYATGVFSSRKLEAASHDSVAFRFICANQHPDHDTIAAFRKRFLPHLTRYFVEVLLIAGQTGLLKLGTVSLDGSKMKANASKNKALSYGHATKLEKQLQREVHALVAMAEDADREDEASHVDIPAELARREDRLVAISDAKRQIEARAAERYEAECAAFEEKIRKRDAKAKETGKKPRGGVFKPPIPGPREKDQINLTDAESRIMPRSGGGFDQAYNIEACVDTRSLLIVGQFATQAANDVQQLEPALKELKALPKALGTVQELLADAGYFSAPNVEAAATSNIEPLIAIGREAHNLPLEERFRKPGPPPPEDAAPLERMRYRLKSPEGRALYGKRKSTVEPVFGQIKRVLGFRQFSLRGLAATSGEWTLVATAYNLRRMFQLDVSRQREAALSA